MEIYQNCNIFNDNAFINHSDRNVRDDFNIFLEDKKPLIFGKDKDKGIMLEGLNLKVIDLKAQDKAQDKDNITDKLLHHDVSDASPLRSYLYTLLDDDPHLPTPFGIFRQIKKPTYETELNHQLKQFEVDDKKVALQELLHSGVTWKVD